MLRAAVTTTMSYWKAAPSGLLLATGSLGLALVVVAATVGRPGHRVSAERSPSAGRRRPGVPMETRHTERAVRSFRSLVAALPYSAVFDSLRLPPTRLGKGTSRKDRWIGGWLARLRLRRWRFGRTRLIRRMGGDSSDFGRLVQVICPGHAVVSPISSRLPCL